MAARPGILLFPFSFFSFLADFKRRKLNEPTLNKAEIRSEVSTRLRIGKWTGSGLSDYSGN